MDASSKSRAGFCTACLRKACLRKHDPEKHALAKSIRAFTPVFAGYRVGTGFRIKIMLKSGFCVMYAELAVSTNFSFLRGASHPEELFACANRLRIIGL